MKNCDQGLENAVQGRRQRAAFLSPRSQFFTIQTDPKPVNNLIFFSKLSNEKKNSQKRNSCKRYSTVTMLRDRKIRTALTTNQSLLSDKNVQGQI